MASRSESTPIANDKHASATSGLGAAAGHGTNVFAREQYRVLLAMRSFGAEELPESAGGTLDVPASLEDIAPTLSAALGVAPERPFDGVSWLPLLQGTSIDRFESRVRYLETEFVPQGFVSGVVLSHSVLRGAASYYRVDPETGRVLIRPEKYESVLREAANTPRRAATRCSAAVPSDSKREQHLVYLERLDAAPIWLDSAPASPDDLGYELWSALRSRFDLVRERPVAPPQGNVD